MSIKPGSKYYLLFEHLQRCNQEVVTLTFVEIETLMGCSLPESARRKKNWWSNRDSPSALQAGAWISAGYHIGFVDLNQQTITFKTFQATYNIQRKDGEIAWKYEPDRSKCKLLNMIAKQANFAEPSTDP